MSNIIRTSAVRWVTNRDLFLVISNLHGILHCSKSWPNMTSVLSCLEMNYFILNREYHSTEYFKLWCGLLIISKLSMYIYCDFRNNMYSASWSICEFVAKIMRDRNQGCQINVTYYFLWIYHILVWPRKNKMFSTIQ